MIIKTRDIFSHLRTQITFSCNVINVIRVCVETSFFTCKIIQDINGNKNDAILGKM